MLEYCYENHIHEAGLIRAPREVRLRFRLSALELRAETLTGSPTCQRARRLLSFLMLQECRLCGLSWCSLNHISSRYCETGSKREASWANMHLCICARSGYAVGGETKRGIPAASTLRRCLCSVGLLAGNEQASPAELLGQAKPCPRTVMSFIQCLPR